MYDEVAVAPCVVDNSACGIDDAACTIHKCEPCMSLSPVYIFIVPDYLDLLMTICPIPCFNFNSEIIHLVQIYGIVIYLIQFCCRYGLRQYFAILLP